MLGQSGEVTPADDDKVGEVMKGTRGAVLWQRMIRSVWSYA